MQRTEDDEPTWTESTTNDGESKRLIPYADNNESKRAELRDSDEDSK